MIEQVTKPLIKIELTITQTQAVLKEMNDRCLASHNHIASAMDNATADYGGSGKDNVTYAYELVAGLRKTQDICKKLRRALMDAGHTPHC